MTRIVTGVLGVLIGGYGAFLLLSRQDLDQLLGAAIWLAAGVVLHDFVLTPLVLVVAVAAARVLPAGIRGAATVAAVVIGSVTLLAVPVLGRFGARPDNPTLLDRGYVGGWLVLVLLVVVGVAIGNLVVRSRRAGPPVRSEGG